MSRFASTLPGRTVITDLVYTLSDSDNGRTLRFQSTVAQVVVAPATLSNSFACSLVRQGAGMLHIFPRSGLTVSSTNGYRVDTAGTATLSLSGSTLTIGGNITTDLVECGGWPTGSFVANNALAAVTMIDDRRNNAISEFASRIRQDGFMRGVKLHVHNTTEDPAGWSYRIFRPNGTDFDFVGKTESFGVPASDIGAIHTRRFTTPVACQSADAAGLYTIFAGDSIDVKTGDTSNNNCRFAAGDVQTTNAFATNVGFTLDHQILAWSSLWGTTGDSIMGGSHTASPFDPYQQGGPSGPVTSQIQYQLRSSLGANLEFVNHARAAMVFTFCLTTGVPACIAAKAAWIHIHCGVNDVAAGRLWADISSELDSIKALLINGERLIIDEILPWTAGTDGNASTIRTFNANLATWCAANGATLLLCHDAMGQNRVSTGHLDDLKTAYAMPDGTHLTADGRDAMAVIWEAAIGLT
jgi:hypothetical protein